MQPLQPLFADAFGFQFLLLRFERGADGTVTGLTVDTSRARGLHFERVPD